MFQKKLDEARAAVTDKFGEVPCACAKAAVTDVIYDMSPALFMVPELVAYINAEQYDMAASTLDNTYWCMDNVNRCSHDRAQIKNCKINFIQ